MQVGKRVRAVGKYKIAFILALIAASRARVVLPQSVSAEQAVALERQGKLVEAEAAWKAVVKEYPSSAEPLAQLGLVEAKQEHYSQAIASYQRAMTLNPNLPGLRLNLGLAYFKAGDYKETIQDLDPLLKAQPDDQRLTILIGMAHYGLGQYAAAAPYLKQAAERDSQNLTLLLTLAHSCLLSNQYPCVLDEFHRIIALSPDSAEAHMLAGEALDEMKEPLEAVRELRAAVEVNPKEPNVHFGLGYLLWKKSEYPEAAKEFRLEIDNDPQHFLATLYLADSDLQMNRPEEAKALLEKLEAIDAGSERQHLDLGTIYATQGQNQAALAEFQQAAKLAPRDANPHWRLGRLYRAMGRKAEAQAEFVKTRTLNETEDERLLKVMSTQPSKSSPPGVPAQPPNQ